MTFSKSDPRTQVNVRLDSELADWLDKETDNQSRYIRALIRKRRANIEQEDGQTEVTPPEDDLLAEAWEALLTLAGDSDTVPVDTAKSMVAQKTGIPKSGVRSAVMKPLQDRGYIMIASDWGGRYSVYRLRRYYNE